MRNWSIKSDWLRATGAYGWLGVEVFFVISGFIIPYSMLHAGYEFLWHFGRHLVKRIIWLEPPYLASIAVVLVLWHVSTAPSEIHGNSGDEDLFLEGKGVFCDLSNPRKTVSATRGTGEKYHL